MTSVFLKEGTQIRETIKDMYILVANYEDPSSIKEILNDICIYFTQNNSHNNVVHNGFIQWLPLLLEKWDCIQKPKG